MTAVQEEVSTFARMVDKLRLMNEAELKLAYIRLFKEDLAKQWETITSEATFGDSTDEDIVTAIQEARYPKENA
jgi:hypothetical protein